MHDPKPHLSGDNKPTLVGGQPVQGRFKGAQPSPPVGRSLKRPVIDIDQALCALVACDGSDLHLKVGSVPLARVDGELGPLSDDAWPVLEPADTEEALHQLLGNSVRMAEFDVENEIDLSHDIPGVARFRINA